MPVPVHLYPRGRRRPPCRGSPGPRTPLRESGPFRWGHGIRAKARPVHPGSFGLPDVGEGRSRVGQGREPHPVEDPFARTPRVSRRAARSRIPASTL